LGFVGEGEPGLLGQVPRFLIEGRAGAVESLYRGCVSLTFHRTVSECLLAHLKPGGRFCSLVERRHRMLGLVDLQLRASTGESHASLYLGLTSVLDLRERNGLFALRAREIHQQRGRFNPDWLAFRPPEELARDWPEVESYLDLILTSGSVDPRWYQREGAVQALLCSDRSVSYCAVQREAVLSSNGGQSVADLVVELSDAVWSAVVAAGRTDAWWPGVRDRGARKPMGNELDVLALDDLGRLLCIEVKPVDETAGIAWAVAQVALYAGLFARWLAGDPEQARRSLGSMAAQRHDLGLLDARWSTIPTPPSAVVPVVAIGPGIRSPEALPRLGEIATALVPVAQHPLIEPVEVWLVAPDGEPEIVWRPADGPPPPGRGRAVAVPTLPGPVTDKEAGTMKDIEPEGPANGFVGGARASAVAWKHAKLPAEAWVPSPYGLGPSVYPFVLPLAHSWENLLPEAREVARTRFSAAGIHWHGDREAPNPHLLSSQVQCLNALAPMVDRPEELRQWLCAFLPVAEVIPFGAATASAYDATDHVVFEWQGLADYLGEWGGRAPTRGARATSVDAAVRYRTPDGAVELALIEWKYTEDYPFGGRLSGDGRRQQTRLSRYRALVESAEGPIRLGRGIDYEDLFAEPTYQLMRQQLLAWRIEEARELEVTRGVVVHCAASANYALLHESLGGHRFERVARLEGGLIPGWRTLLRRPDRFVSVDTTDLVAPGSVLGDTFKERYAHLRAPAVPSGEAETAAMGSVPQKLSGGHAVTLARQLGAGRLWLGRRGGLGGPLGTADVASGAWRMHMYPAMTGNARKNGDWFSVAQLLEAIRDAGLSE
jgi:hypothetical protein